MFQFEIITMFYPFLIDFKSDVYTHHILPSLKVDPGTEEVKARYRVYF